MILRNYYNVLAAHALGITSTDTTTFGDGHINIKTIDGTITETGYATNDDAGGTLPAFGRIGEYESYPRYFFFTAIQFGTGSTAVTFDDYALQAPISTSVFSGSNFIYNTPTYNASTGKFSNTVTMVVTNNSSSSVTAAEIGIFEKVRTGAGTSAYARIMVYREVLDTPFTLAAGESVTYTQNLEFTMPTV